MKRRILPTLDTEYLILNTQSMETRICQNCKQSFTIEAEDFAFYEKMEVPAPTFCPECREQRRIAFRNERALYKRKCDLCGEVVVSRVSPNKPYPMYCKKCWWSDNWDPMRYGREYDFSRSFFEQFRDLLCATPHLSIFNSNVVNSDWVNQETDDKNCYLNVGGHFNEDSAYNTYAIRCKDVFDSYWLLQSELCYGNVNCERCYQTFFSRECFDSQNVFFSYDCRNCMCIIGCAGLRNKQYCIFNRQVSREEYETFRRERPMSSHHALLLLQKEAEVVWLSVPHRDRILVQSHNSSGNFVTQSKNARHCFNAEKVEDSAYLYIAAELKDTMDLSSVGWGELMYEAGHSVGSYNSKFFTFVLGGGSAETVGTSNLEYCFATFTCRDCFGCAHLRGKQYCILNKQYTEDEYRTFRRRIIEQMRSVPYMDLKGRVYCYGEFFPVELSPFGYNETAANDHFPLTREEALNLGFPWCDYESDIQYTISDYAIPDDIQDVKDDILEKILKCEESGKAYRIIPMELFFYRKVGLAIPRRGPLQRHSERLRQLLPWKLFERKCDCGQQTRDLKLKTENVYKNTAVHFHGEGKCPHLIQTAYSPDRTEIVYCEECYQAEVA